MSHTLTYALGRGKWAGMGLLLSRSIAKFAPGCEQIAFIPANEAPDIPSDVRRECASNGQVIEAKPPNPEYPIATKLKAFELAAERSETDHTVLLDTDTLVLDELTQLGCGTGNLHVRPAFFRSRRWETGMGEVMNREVFKEFGFKFPTETVTSAVDGKEMPACWNAGVIGTTDRDLPRELLDLTLEVHERFPDQRFADQIALAMLATELDTAILSEVDNYPAGYRLRFPSNIRILHYHAFHHLSRICNGTLQRKFQRIAVPEVRSRYASKLYHLSVLKYIGTNLLHRIIGW